MTIQPITGIMISIVCVLTLVVMVYWHLLTKGAWWQWTAGRAVMGLLGTQSAITALAAASSFFPAFPGRPIVYLVLYGLLILAVGGIGWAIRAEHRKNSD